MSDLISILIDDSEDTSVVLAVTSISKPPGKPLLPHVETGSSSGASSVGNPAVSIRLQDTGDDTVSVVADVSTEGRTLVTTPPTRPSTRPGDNGQQAPGSYGTGGTGGNGEGGHQWTLNIVADEDTNITGLASVDEDDKSEQVIANEIVGTDLGQEPGTIDAAWPVFVVNMPDRPSDCILIRAQAPILQGRYMTTGEYAERQAIQIIVRANRHIDGQIKIKQIVKHLDGLRNKKVELVYTKDTYNTQQVYIQPVSIVHGGEEVVHAGNDALSEPNPLPSNHIINSLTRTSGPLDLGRDLDNKSSNRYMFSVNYTLTLDLEES